MKIFTLCCFLFFFVGNNPDSNLPKLHFEKVKSLPQPVYGMTYVSDGNYIYSIGGGSSYVGETNEIFAYHIESDQWIKIPSKNIFKPFKLGWGEFLPKQKKIIFMGGIEHGTRSHHEITKELVNDICIFDPKEIDFKIVSPNIHQAVDAGVATWNGKMYIFGGSVPFKNTRTRVDYTDAFHEYDPETGEWFELPSMPMAKVTKGRIVNGVLYTFGGKDDKPQKQIHQYDIEKKEWKEIGKIKHGVSDFSITQYKNKIILLGDWRIPNSMYVFDTESKKLTSLRTNIHRRHSGAVIVDGKLYVFGGMGRENIEDDTWVLDLTKIKLFN